MPGEVQLQAPWRDGPPCPTVRDGKVCGTGRTLTPLNPAGWSGPIEEATIFCPACGTGWDASDEEIERAIVAESWFNALEEADLSEEAFLWATAGEPVPCGKTCFRRGCQQPDRHWGKNAKLCPSPECFNGKAAPCRRCRYLLNRMRAEEIAKEAAEAAEAAAQPHLFEVLVGWSMSHGAKNIGQLPGCWERSVPMGSGLWHVAINGHDKPTKSGPVPHGTDGGEIDPFSAFVWWNGWPAGAIDMHGWQLVAGDVANEKSFRSAIAADKPQPAAEARHE